MDEYETLQRLLQLVDTQDPEAQHIQADRLLVEFLRHLGYWEIADAFEKIQKYYA